MLGDLFRGLGDIVGSALSLSVEVVASTLDITTGMVEEAKEAGCKTMDDIKKYHGL